MMTLPIADCRLPIEPSFAGRRFARRGHDGSKLAGFRQQCGQLAGGHRSRFDQQFQPQGGFIHFFLDYSNFGDEFGLTARAATGAIIGGNRSAAADNLFGDDPSGIVTFRNRPGQFDDAQGKGFGSCFQFGRVHGANIQIQSAIGNRQSAIQR